MFNSLEVEVVKAFGKYTEKRISRLRDEYKASHKGATHQEALDSTRFAITDRFSFNARLPSLKNKICSIEIFLPINTHDIDSFTVIVNNTIISEKRYVVNRSSSRSMGVSTPRVFVRPASTRMYNEVLLSALYKLGVKESIHYDLLLESSLEFTSETVVNDNSSHTQTPPANNQSDDFMEDLLIAGAIVLAASISNEDNTPQEEYNDHIDDLTQSDHQSNEDNDDDTEDYEGDDFDNQVDGLDSDI